MNPQPLTVGSLQPRERDLGPWSSDHLFRMCAANGIGIVLIVAGWWQAAGKAEVAGQLTWTNVGLVGLGIAAAANAGWLYRGRRAIGLARVMLVPGVRSQTRVPVHGAPVNRDRVVVGRSMSRYHIATCPFVDGREVDTVERTAIATTLAPCEVCEP